ncbi:MAG: hypothetical protein AAGC73_08555 [Verrucomicrobiota bacterium]
MPPLLIFLFLFLISRFAFLSEGSPLTVMRWAIKCLVDVAALSIVFRLTPECLIVCLIALLANTAILMNEVFEQEAKPKTRSLSLVIVLALAIIYMERIQIHGLRPGFWLQMSPAMLALICSILLCLKESNFVIRWFFEDHRLIDKTDNSGSKTENGRIIGNLARFRIGAPGITLGI